MWWVFFLTLVGLGFNLELSTCKAGVVLLESHLQPILLWLFADGVIAGFQTGASQSQLCILRFYPALKGKALPDLLKLWDSLILGCLLWPYCFSFTYFWVVLSWYQDFTRASVESDNLRQVSKYPIPH
jgi:hypothetical protein